MKPFAPALLCGLLLLSAACSATRQARRSVAGTLPSRPKTAVTGSQFVQKVLADDPETRETRIAEEILKGNFPRFMRKPVRIDVQTTAPDGRLIRAYYFVLPDYLMIGSDRDFVRMPMQPKTAQRIADRFGFFLSTKKICDDVYRAARVKLEPMPLTVQRDSLRTFYEHHRIIEDQRMGRRGLIAGIKKDVILTSAITRDKRPRRLALYGWHKPDGKPIQPVYTGHVDWYVDYSHGFRLVSRHIWVEGEPMLYTAVLQDPVLSRLICDEPDCGFYAYPYEEK